MECLRQRVEICFIQRIDDNVTRTFSLKLGQSVSDRFHTLMQRPEVDAANRAWRLRAQQARQAGIGHGIERMLFHSGLVKQYAVYKKMAVHHRAPVLRQGGAVDDHRSLQVVHQRIADWSNVACWRGVKR